MDRMNELVALLNRYAREYYEQDSPTVADAEYDALYDELVKLEATLGVLPESPTKRVGGVPQAKFSTHKHLGKLYSLDKCKSEGELSEWLLRLEKAGANSGFTVEYKYDGLTVNLTYEKGILTRATTRGNGEVGEDITLQVSTIVGIPNSIACKDTIEVQGEAIMLLSTLEEYNKTANEPLKNARNAAAGAIRNLDAEVTRSRGLKIACYNVGYREKGRFGTQTEMHEFLIEQGFPVGFYFERATSKNDIIKRVEEIEKSRSGLDFLIDGAVIKIDSIALQEELGFTQKFPRFALAYKFAPQEMTTTLLDVVWQVSRTGKLNPLAILEPVDIGGVTVKRATLNNIKEITRKDIRVGSKVFIRRSNDVIPEIPGVAEHTKDSRIILPPKFCPACGAPVREEDIFIYCTNPNCAPKIISSLEHFACKDALDIDGVSDKTAELIYNELNVRTPLELYKLTREQLLSLDGFKDKKADNLLASLNASKKTELFRFIHALGIPNIGKKSARELVSALSNLDNIRTASYDEILAIRDFGDISAQSVCDFFAKSENKYIVEGLLAVGFEFAHNEVKEGIFSGKTVVLTGTLNEYKRSEATKLIEERGGKTSDTVNKLINLVVVGENAGSKRDKAIKMGIEIIDEETFSKLIKN